MLSIETCPLPEDALLKKYDKDGTYTDCFTTVVDGSTSHAEYVIAFYTTFIFKLERFILKWLISKPSSDLQVKQLAEGSLNEFAAWTVEDRAKNQLLMCDFQSRTRSWLMVIPEISDNTKTRLYFGSAIVPEEDPETGELRIGFVYRALLGFHKIYSVILLRATKSRIKI